MITRVAAAGRLRMSVERATEVMHSTGVGTILNLIGHPEQERDLRNAREAREMVINTLTLPSATPDEGGPAATGPAATGAAVASPATALLAALGEDGTAPLSTGERTLLLEWLNRLADGADADA
ncbi:hypothetical protein ACFY6U_06045 [Streptomyces sp. NPDC013157]|uniref:hypothetical protein n=1 Tax=Streptomyces sp. NPDC013157 TaxID=3364861 RepID=UPI0036A56495